MTAPSAPGRASALYQRALAGVADPEGPEPARAPASSPRLPALPGAGVLTVVLVGSAFGLAATAAAVGRGWDPGDVAVGAWVTRPNVGTPSIDPYAQAALARSGAVPMAASEGLSFTATMDDTGYRLLRSCAYRLTGGMPPARFWTLTATGGAGLPPADPARRSAFTSTEVIRDAGGSVTIDVGADARPGNWLPVSGDGPLTLTLRLYDTPLTAGSAEDAGAALPGIARQGCRGGR